MAADASAAFISYSREDLDFALRLAVDLKAAGAVVWIDQLDIIGGQRWDRAVEDALNRCPRLLVILSPASVESDNVLDEVSRALRKQKTVIPVFYLDCDVPLRLERLHQVDFRTDYARGLKALLRALGVEQQVTAPRGVLRESRPAVSNVIEPQPAAEQEVLEQERIQAAEQARLEQERKQAAEQARLEQERKQAAERARLEQERKQAAEQARLEQERKQAAERARLEQERKQDAEQARLEHEGEAAMEGNRQGGLRSNAVAVEKQRQRLAQNETTKGTGSELGFFSKLPVLPAVAVAICGLLILALVLRLALSTRRPSNDQTAGAQKQLARADAPNPPASGALASNQPRDAPTITGIKTENKKLSPSGQTPPAPREQPPVTVVTPQSGWVVGDKGTLLHTEDGGRSWRQEGNRADAHLHSVTFVNLQSGWAVGGTFEKGTIWHTEDGGRSWHKQSGDPVAGLYSVTFVNPESGWAVGGTYATSTILHTKDGGRTWLNQSSSIGVGLSSVTFVTPESGWLAGLGGTLLHTEDGGHTWKQQSIHTSADIESVAFVSPESGWAVGSLGTILHTEDGGRSWQKQSMGTQAWLFSVIFVTPQSGWAVGRPGVIRHTEDGGRTWQKQRSGTSLDLYSVTFVTPQSGWVVGERGTILYTEDGGSNWQKQSSGTSADLNSVTFVRP